MKNQHCEYCQVCDKNIDCSNGEKCQQFKNISSPLENIIPFPKHRTKEAITRAKSIKRLLDQADKLNW